METFNLTITAPMFIHGRWEWMTWLTSHANKHAAVLEKARETGATAWDFAQSDIERV